MKKITKPEVIGGLMGITIHFFVEHQADFQSAFTFGIHNLNGIAFVLAGAYIGLKFGGKK